jgi:5-methylcytosine-specific restriction endonuclease McrA
MKKYSQLNEEEKREYHRAAWRRYYHRNSKRFIDKSLNYQKNHPEQWKKINNRATRRYKEKTRYNYMREILLKEIGCCQNCGSTDNLQIHHKNKKSYHNNQIPDNRKENLELLCQKCHLQYHYYNGDTLNKSTRDYSL